MSPAAVGPTNVTPPIVHPTQCCETHTFSNTIVPHIHPTHTTFVNHHMVQNQHYFPQTQSAANTIQETNVPGYGPSPLVAGAMAGPMPGYGPGPMPGYGPGPQVAGAMTGPMPGYGPGPQVAGAMTGPMMKPMVSPATANANPMLGGMFKK
ncbi:CotD family spore coat protein [Microbacteriaceae bacterium 4G12]